LMIPGLPTKILENAARLKRDSP